MLRNRLLLLLALTLPTAACDNVGLAFDPSVDPNNPANEDGESAVQVVPVGGDTRDGRPQVREVYPQGSGWPSTVPIVVEFSESINRASIFPTSVNGVDGRIGVRVRGTGQLLPASYDLLGGGKLLVIRPLTPLPNDGFPVYEVVLFPESRDVDGLRFQVDGSEEILGDFQVNQGESIVDGAVVAVFPRDNFDDHPREGAFFVIFDKPANASTLTSANIALAAPGLAAVAADVATPLSVLGVPDPRIVRLQPSVPLAEAQRYEFTVTTDITFGQSGNLDFNGAVPFSVFDTVAPAAPERVEVAAPAAGFENCINAGNIDSLQLEVALPADAKVGDTVVARVYGGDADTTATFDEAFIERSAAVAAVGAPVVVDFTGALGTAASPALDEGEVTFAAQLRRGNQRSGYIRSDAAAAPVLDVTPPTLTSAGPPGSGGDVYSDGEWLAFFGVASEDLSSATLTDGDGAEAGLFASSGGGRFLMLPVALGRRTSNQTFSLNLTDAAGNVSVETYNGDVVQRGAITGDLQGTLTVRVFDDATFEPVADATVLVDPAAPSAPAVDQLLGTTDQDGVAQFATALASHTITVIHPDFDLISIVDTQAADVSLPLQSVNETTATLTGKVLFEPAAGVTAIVGTTAAADRRASGVQTSASDPSDIPPTPILPNRTQVVTAFGGSFEPVATPAYALSGSQFLGLAFTQAAAPPLPAAPGGESEVNLALAPVPPIAGGNALTDPSLIAPQALDLALAVGLDTADLLGGAPRARTSVAVRGFSGQVLTGIGVATPGAGATFSVNATYSLPIILALAGYTPLSWLVTEAEDASGRIARTRALLAPEAQIVIAGPGPLPIPTVSGGSFANPPAVTFEDVVDAAVIVGGLGFSDLTVSDEAGRVWRVLTADRDDASAPNTLQLPDLSASPTPGLALGSWEVFAESRIFLSDNGATVDDLVLTDRFRQEVLYSRSAAVTVTVN